MKYIEAIEVNDITTKAIINPDHRDTVIDLELNLYRPCFHKIVYVPRKTGGKPGHFVTLGHSQGDEGRVFTPSTFDKANNVQLIAHRHEQAREARELAITNAKLPGDLLDPAHKLT